MDARTFKLVTKASSVSGRFTDVKKNVTSLYGWFSQVPGQVAFLITILIRNYQNYKRSNNHSDG
jgi:hypothetical protein